MSSGDWFSLSVELFLKCWQISREPMNVRSLKIPGVPHWGRNSNGKVLVINTMLETVGLVWRTASKSGLHKPPSKHFNCYLIVDTFSPKAFVAINTHIWKNVWSLLAGYTFIFDLQQFDRLQFFYIHFCLSMREERLKYRFLRKPVTLFRTTQYFHCPTYIMGESKRFKGLLHSSLLLLLQIR